MAEVSGSLSSKNSTKLLLKWVIAIGVTVACLFIPVDEIFTVQTRNFVAVTVFCILLLALNLLDQGLIGLLLPFLWVITGCATFTQAMSGWASSYPLMFFGAFILVTILQRIGLLERIGYKIIVMAGGTFNRTIWALFIIAHIVALVTFTMGQAITLTIALSIAAAFEIKKEDPEALPILCAVVLGAVQCSPYIYNPITMTMINGAALGFVPTFAPVTPVQLLGHNAPVLLFNIAFMWGFLKWFNKRHPGIGSRDTGVQKELFKLKLEEMGKITSAEKKALVVIALMLVYMFSASFFGLDIGYGFLGAAIVLWLPFMEVGTSQDVAEAAKISLPIMLLVLAFISIGTVGTACGFGALITVKLVPLVSQFGYVGSIYATLGVGTLSNFILTPGAMVMLLTGPVVQFATELGFNALPHIYSIYLTEHAIFHPYEWPMYLVIYAFGLISMNRFVKFCCVKTTIFLAFVCLVMVPWWIFIVG